VNPLIAALRRIGVLPLILALAALVRLWGIAFGLPHPLTRPDEEAIASVASRFFRGDLNPRFFNYPALFPLIVAACLAAGFRLKRAAGWPGSAEDFLQAASPTGLHLTARFCSATAGVASVWVLQRAGQRLFDRESGLVAALFLSLAFLHVRDSHFGVTDVAATFFVVAAFLFTVRLAVSGKARDLVPAAIAAGLAASTKYNAALVALPAAWALASGASSSMGTLAVRLAKLALFGAVMAGAFFAASPYSLLNFHQFLDAVRYESGHLAGGHGTMVGRGWVVHLTSSLRYGLGIPLLATSIAGLGLLARREPRKAVLVGVFPVAYYAAIGSGFTVFARYIIPVLPFLCLTAGYAVTAAARWIAASSGRREWAPAATWVLALAIVAPSAVSVAQFDQLIAREDSRLVAARWLEAQFPKGATVAQIGTIYAHVVFPPERAWQYPSVEPGPGVPEPEAIVLAVSPIHEPPPLSERERTLLAAYRRAHTVRAFHRRGANAYDWQDDFYLPLGGFRGVERPGPNLDIYVRGR
jgi:4-amino-4-deoxy-L-arabinose transferase-like glycosyltransferase